MPELPMGTVTFLFSDLEGSTRLLQHLGARYTDLLADHRRLLRAAFHAAHGCEIDTAGDGFFVVFESARSAVEAAVGGQIALARFQWPEGAEVRVRMGLHTAEPHLGEEGYVGLGVHRASRICDSGHGGQILVSNATAGIIEDAELEGVALIDLGQHRLKGIPRDQRLFQLEVATLPSEFRPPRSLPADVNPPGAGTFLFSDLTGWRHVIQILGDEASSSLAADYQAVVSAVVEANNGATLERAGDHVLAVFRDASDAIRAADAAREAIGEFAWPAGCEVGLAIALHSGRWSGDAGQPRASTAIIRVLGVRKVGHPGQTLVSQATASLLEGDLIARRLQSLGEQTVPEFEEPTRLYELAAPS
jgi:class 3 adenylate cyclase